MSPDNGSRLRNGAFSQDQAVVSNGLTLKGEITGTDPLYIDGDVEGAINIPGERVTVGKNGHVSAAGVSPAACITAREIVVMGRVTGNISAIDRVDIRADGAVIGDILTARISIEDGAFFRGGIDIRRSESKPVLVPEPAEAVASV